MPKPYRIGDEDKILFVDNFPIRRVQDVGWTATFPVEDITQLGTEATIDRIWDTITTTSTMTLNMDGRIEPLTIFTRQSGLTTAGVEQASTASTTTVIKWANASGTSANVGRIVRFLSGSNAGMSRVITAETTGSPGSITVSEAFPAAPAVNDMFEVLDYAVEEADFQDAVTDFVVPVQEGTSFVRSTWLPAQALTGISFSVPVDGIATWSFTFDGDADMEFLATYRDAEAYRGLFATTTTFKVYGDLSAGYVKLYGTINGKLIQATDLTIGAYAAGKTTITVANQSALQSGDRMELIVYRATPRIWTSLVTAADTNRKEMGAIRRNKIEVYLANRTLDTTYDGLDPISFKGVSLATLNSALASMSKSLRIQSVDGRVDLARTPLLELNNLRPYHRELDTPVPVELTLTCLESDLEMYGRLAGKDFASVNEIQAQYFTETASEGKNDLYILFYDQHIEKSLGTGTPATTDRKLLLALRFVDLSVASRPVTTTVGGNSMMNFTLRGTKFYAEQVYAPIT